MKTKKNTTNKWLIFIEFLHITNKNKQTNKNPKTQMLIHPIRKKGNEYLKM